MLQKYLPSVIQTLKDSNSPRLRRAGLIQRFISADFLMESTLTANGSLNMYGTTRFNMESILTGAGNRLIFGTTNFNNECIVTCNGKLLMGGNVNFLQELILQLTGGTLTMKGAAQFNNELILLSDLSKLTFYPPQIYNLPLYIRQFLTSDFYIANMKQIDLMIRQNQNMSTEVKTGTDLILEISQQKNINMSQ